MYRGACGVGDWLCPGTSSPTSTAQALRTKSSEFAVCPFQPSRPTRPSETRATRPAVNGGLLRAASSAIAIDRRLRGSRRSARGRTSGVGLRCDRAHLERPEVDRPGHPRAVRGHLPLRTSFIRAIAAASRESTVAVRARVGRIVRRRAWPSKTVGFKPTRNGSVVTVSFVFNTPSFETVTTVRNAPLNVSTFEPPCPGSPPARSFESGRRHSPGRCRTCGGRRSWLARNPGWSSKRGSSCELRVGGGAQTPPALGRPAAWDGRIRGGRVDRFGRRGRRD